MRNTFDPEIARHVPLALLRDLDFCDVDVEYLRADYDMSDEVRFHNRRADRLQSVRFTATGTEARREAVYALVRAYLMHLRFFSDVYAAPTIEAYRDAWVHDEPRLMRELDRAVGDAQRNSDTHIRMRQYFAGTMRSALDPRDVRVTLDDPLARPRETATEAHIRVRANGVMERITQEAMNQRMTRLMDAMFNVSAPEPGSRERSLELLRRCLKPEQREHWDRYRHFHVYVDVWEGGAWQRRTLRIQSGYAFNVLDVATGRHYCAGPEGPEPGRQLPLGDFLLGQKLMLETDPAAWFERANAAIDCRGDAGTPLTHLLVRAVTGNEKPGAKPGLIERIRQRFTRRRDPFLADPL